MQRRPFWFHFVMFLSVLILAKWVESLVTTTAMAYSYSSLIIHVFFALLYAGFTTLMQHQVK